MSFQARDAIFSKNGLAHRIRERPYVKAIEVLGTLRARLATTTAIIQDFSAFTGSIEAG